KLHGGLRNLHSFPTRRSSDLVTFTDLDINPDSNNKVSFFSPLNIILGLNPIFVSNVPILVSFLNTSQTVLKGVFNFPSIDLSCRSEEHTSELQSRENLVCRLL